MEIQKETNGKRKVLIIGLVLLALIIAASLYAYFAVLKQNETKDATDVIPEEVFESDRDQTDDIQKNPDNKDQAPNTDHPSQPDTPNESGKKQLQMVASFDQSNGVVYIRGGINYPVSEGACYALLTGPSGQSVRKDSTILQNPASTDCKTIQIPSSELAQGAWTFALHFTSNEYEGASSEVSFNL